MKKILAMIGILFFLLLGVEIYWYLTNGANLVIFAQNQSDKTKIINVKISLNDEQIFNKALHSGEIMPKEINLKKRIGVYNLEIWREDKNEIVKEKFHLLLVKWVVIDVYSNNIIINYSYIPPVFQ